MKSEKLVKEGKSGNTETSLTASRIAVSFGVKVVVWSGRGELAVFFLEQ